MKFLDAIANVFRIPDLRKRVLFTLGLLAVYRLGGHIPIPGINMGDYFTGGSPGFVPTNLPGGSGGTQGTAYGDGLNVNRCNCPLTQKEDQFQIVNNWTKIFGAHSIKLGVDLRYARNLRIPSDTDRAGQLNFAGGPTCWGSARKRR